jgi:hypothetical protein
MHSVLQPPARSPGLRYVDDPPDDDSADDHRAEDRVAAQHCNSVEPIAGEEGVAVDWQLVDVSWEDIAREEPVHEHELKVIERVGDEKVTYHFQKTRGTRGWSGGDAGALQRAVEFIKDRVAAAQRG